MGATFRVSFFCCCFNIASLRNYNRSQKEQQSLEEKVSINDAENGDDDVDEDDCNATPCKIEDIVSKSNQVLEWVQCQQCPKWFHQYCVGVVDPLFKCNSH